MDPTCLFCKIVAKQIPTQPVYEDDLVLAFKDIRPVAPTHLLVIPKAHFSGLNDATPEHEAAIGRAFTVAAKIARDQGFADNGYRTVINTGAHAGQTVFHLHVHVLAGRDFTWPPG